MAAYRPSTGYQAKYVLVLSGFARQFAGGQTTGTVARDPPLVASYVTLMVKGATGGHIVKPTSSQRGSAGERRSTRGPRCGAAAGTSDLLGILLV